MRIKDIGEIGLIRELAKVVRRPDRNVRVGIGDDTAVVRPIRGMHMLLTCDMLIEDVHFTRRAAKPYRVGWKAMARNVSDIAAMGGLPRYALVSVAIDPRLPVSYAKELARGMGAVAKRFGFSIVGGDTSRSRKIVIDIALVGEAAAKKLPLRSGARKGDLIFVTGSIGGSGKGRHLDFMPRLDEARAITRLCDVNAMIDISDGLLIDLRRILDASGCGARIFRNAVPLSKGAGSFDRAVREGEDFELLFTMSRPEALRFLRTAPGKLRTPVTLIGVVTGRSRGLVLSTETGERRIPAGDRSAGFVHF